MVLFQLILVARTQNVLSISMPTEGDWHFRIKCCGCNQEYPKQVTVSNTQHIEVIKQQVNFLAKCKNCQRKGTITISSNSSYMTSANEDGLIKQTIAVLDCRGVQVIQVILGNSLTVTSKSDTVYQNADFTDLWAQYDEKLSQLCQVQQPKVIITRK